jgi:hypothetical protein
MMILWSMLCNRSRVIKSCWWESTASMKISHTYHLPLWPLWHFLPLNRLV